MSYVNTGLILQSTFPGLAEVGAVCIVDINDVDYTVLQEKAQFEMELLVQLKYTVLICVSVEGRTWSRDLFILYRIVWVCCGMNSESCGGLP